LRKVLNGPNQTIEHLLFFFRRVFRWRGSVPLFVVQAHTLLVVDVNIENHWEEVEVLWLILQKKNFVFFFLFLFLFNCRTQKGSSLYLYFSFLFLLFVFQLICFSIFLFACLLSPETKETTLGLLSCFQ
jgi:hypothetical protein